MGSRSGSGSRLERGSRGDPQEGNGPVRELGIASLRNGLTFVSVQIVLTILVAKNEVLGGLSELVVDLLHASGYVEFKVFDATLALLCALKDLDVLYWQSVASLLAAVAEAQVMAARLSLSF